MSWLCFLIQESSSFARNNNDINFCDIFKEFTIVDWEYEMNSSFFLLKFVFSFLLLFFHVEIVEKKKQKCIFLQHKFSHFYTAYFEGKQYLVEIFAHIL